MRGDQPIGVNFDKRYGTYNAHCNNQGESVWLGSFKTSEEAFEAYKLYKEKIIKEMAEEYKLLIPNELYVAMMNYTVDIND